MKLVIYVLSLCFISQWALASDSSSPALGDNLETTLEKLGQPVGTIELRDKTLLLYPEGEVVLKSDAVVEIDLMSDSEYAAEQARLQIEREEWQRQKQQREAAHRQQGQAIVAEKRSSSVFASLPAKHRVDFWRNFQSRYPDIDVTEDLARALEGYETELAELKNQERVAQLEARVAKAEQEAAEARLEAEKLKAQTVRTRQSSHYGLRYYYDPVVQPSIIHRPPTVTIHSNGQCVTTQNNPPNYWKFRNYNPNGTAERVTRILHHSN